jgi:hypothetical protein
VSLGSLYPGGRHHDGGFFPDLDDLRRCSELTPDKRGVERVRGAPLDDDCRFGRDDFFDDDGRRLRNDSLFHDDARFLSGCMSDESECERVM